MLVLVGAPSTVRRPAREVLVLVLVGPPSTARRPALVKRAGAPWQQKAPLSQCVRERGRRLER